MEYQPVKLFYKEEGRGIPVVLLHGFPLDHTIWQAIVPELAGKARLILPDLRGHGHSPVTDEMYTMRLLAEDIVALLDDLKIERAIVVGHSMGGYVSLAFAHAFPWRLAGLGLVATHAASDNPERRQGRYLMIEKIKRRGVLPLVKDMGTKLTIDPSVAGQLESIMMNTSPTGMINSLKGMAERPDMTQELSSMDVPAVVIAGKEDPILPVEKARTTAQLLSKAWFVEVPQAGHMPMLEAPREVAAALLQLIEVASST